MQQQLGSYEFCKIHCKEKYDGKYEHVCLDEHALSYSGVYLITDHGKCPLGKEILFSKFSERKANCGL